MAPREFSSDEGDEEMLTPATPAEQSEPNEGTSLLVMMPQKDKGRLQKRDTWTTQAQSEIMEQSKTFLPTLQSMIFSKIPWFITLRILGEMDGASEGTDNGMELAGAALANTLCNVTGMSLCIGVSFALSTLAGQAKGEMISRYASTSNLLSAEDREVTPNTPVVFLLRGLLIQIIIVLPVGIWWLFGIEDFLVRLGQTPELSAHAAAYLKILAPSLWIYAIQWTINSWCQSIGMADVPASAAALGLALHIPFNVLFCYVLGMGYLGCAYATLMFQTVRCIYNVCYLFFHPKGRQRILESTGGSAIGRTTLTFVNEMKIAWGSIRAFCDYLALALPGIIIISEWWASETAIFISGRLGPNPQTTLAAMTIYQSINAFSSMIPYSFSVAGTSRVGNLLGAGNPSGAALAGKVSVSLCGLFSGVVGVILFTFPHGFFPGLFVSASENREIVDQTAATIPLLAFYVFADGVQTGLNGIIKGCGRQRIIMPIVLVAYWVVGLPLAYYLGLHRSGGDDTMCAHIASDGSYDPSEGGLVLCGDVGLVAGMTTGTWVHMLLMFAVVIGTTNWKEEAYKAKQRVIADQKRQKRQKQRRQSKEQKAADSQKNDIQSSKSDGYLC